MFKRRTHTQHTQTRTRSYISIKLSLLRVLFPFFPLSSRKSIRASVHVRLRALSAALRTQLCAMCLHLHSARARLCESVRLCFVRKLKHELNLFSVLII